MDWKDTTTKMRFIAASVLLLTSINAGTLAPIAFTGNFSIPNSGGSMVNIIILSRFTNCDVISDTTIFLFYYYFTGPISRWNFLPN